MNVYLVNKIKNLKKVREKKLSSDVIHLYIFFQAKHTKHTTEKMKR